MPQVRFPRRPPLDNLVNKLRGKAGVSVRLRRSHAGNFWLLHFAEYEDLVLRVPVEGLRDLDQVPQHLGGLRHGQDNGFLGAVTKDQLVGEIGILELAIVSLVGVYIGHLRTWIVCSVFCSVTGLPSTSSSAHEANLSYPPGLASDRREESPRFPHVAVSSREDVL